MTTPVNEPGNPSALIPTFELINSGGETHAYPETWEEAIAQLAHFPSDTLRVQLRAKTTHEALTELARAWKGYQPTPHNDFADGYNTGANDAANELLDWLKNNG
jgi:hypothetical protein